MKRVLSALLLLQVPIVGAVPVGCADIMVAGDARGSCASVALIGSAEGGVAVVGAGTSSGNVAIAGVGHANATSIGLVIYGKGEHHAISLFPGTSLK